MMGPLRLASVQGDTPLPLEGWSESTLEQVLLALQEEDELFDYNVPEGMRDPSRPDLQEFLVKTYRQSDFEITDPATIKDHIDLYDWVQHNAKEPYFEYLIFIKPGMQGEIVRVNPKHDPPLTIAWDPCEEIKKGSGLDSYSPVQRFAHSGEDLSLLPGGIFRRRKVTDREELLKVAREGMRVESRSTKFRYRFYLPVGATGIVTELVPHQEKPVKVVFGKSEGYVGPIYGSTFECKYEDLKLVRENPIDLRKILHGIGSH
jgi:hypothetical protein